MWTLECNGDSLSYKKIWLRPGKRYLFGRTKEPRGRDVGFKIDHKTVSRQHLTLSVSSVKPGHGALVRDRSEISLKDENTKFCTEIDGDQIKGEARLLKNDEHIFRPGKSDQTFHLKWEPVVFTVSLGTKESKSEDPLAKYRNRLEDLDIKVVEPYIIDSTTHVVATKRNTAKGLQALINAKYIVTDTYFDSLVYATTPTNLDEDESLSPLEEDFTANWPQPFEHPPAKSKEPCQRPSEDFAPIAQRISVFEGYTFVFCDPAQFLSLQAMVNNGGGKAVECKIEHGKTTTDDIVRYVKSHAGEKGLGEFEDGSEGKGVVVVQFRGVGEHEEWAKQLDRSVAQALDHRLIQQSEFLEAILANDASMLRRPLLPNSDSVSTRSQGVAVQEHTERVNGHAQVESKDTSRKRVQPRAKIESRFKGFDSDDNDEVEASAPISSRQNTIKSQLDSVPSNSRSQGNSKGQAFSDEDSMVEDSQIHVNGHTPAISQSQNTRKRPAPLSSDEDDDDEDLMDKILPAAAAMKRRRIEIDADGAPNGHTQGDAFMSQPQPKPEKKRKAVKAVNIKEVVRERKKIEEEAFRQEEESLRDNVDGMSVEEMKKLAVVEEMSVPERHRDHQRTNGDDGARWDERWNGRKNFKKFRRRGENGQARRGQSVIVPLEEVKKKDFGIGEDYWLERDGEKAKKKRKEKEDDSLQPDSQHTPFTTARSQPVEVPAELTIDIDGEESQPVNINAPRRTRHQEQTQETQEDTPRSQLANGRKRPAPGPAPGRPIGPKKRKKFAAAKDSDSDD